MKELFRERDAARIGFYQSILEAEGIPTHVRNRDLVTTMGTEVPIPEFFPALCVVDDEDYELAIECLRENAAEDGAPDLLPHETKGIVAFGVCAICGILIACLAYPLLGRGSFLVSTDSPMGIAVTALFIVACLAGIWAVLRSYRATKLRQRAQ
jgi:hypothetical protein